MSRRDSGGSDASLTKQYKSEPVQAGGSSGTSTSLFLDRVQAECEVLSTAYEGVQQDDCSYYLSFYSTFISLSLSPNFASFDRVKAAQRCAARAYTQTMFIVNVREGWFSSKKHPDEVHC